MRFGRYPLIFCKNGEELKLCGQKVWPNDNPEEGIRKEKICAKLCWRLGVSEEKALEYFKRFSQKK